MLFSAAGSQVGPNVWMILPFVILLLGIALGPLLFPKVWSRSYAPIAIGLGLITTVYYLFGLQHFHRLLEAGHEYISFIALIGSLYVVSGGIHLNIRGEATPFANSVFLLFGGVIANLLGTTGASMLLIRPWLRMNHYRVTAHHVVFFIFVVSNLGGGLTPIGDPPLYLGYVKGVPFWWVAEHCWQPWLLGMAWLLTVFYFVDLGNYRRAPKPVREEHTRSAEWFQIEGGKNFMLIGVILAAVLWANQWPFLREGILVAAAVASYFLTPKSIHHSNDFSFHALNEVAILFIGIFATMIPALDWLKIHASDFGQPVASLFYWGSGILSSVLDNAPTYLSFLEAAIGSVVPADGVGQIEQLLKSGNAALGSVTGPNAPQITAAWNALQQYHGAEIAAGKVTRESIEVSFLISSVAWSNLLAAISVGAVFFGANTYIGNGPNFMVKAISDQMGVKTPSFLGYVGRFSLPIMGPMLVAIWWAFFR